MNLPPYAMRVPKTKWCLYGNKNIRKTCSDALNVRKCQQWFVTFRSGVISLEDSACWDSYRYIDVAALRVLVESPPCHFLSRVTEKWQKPTHVVVQIQRVNLDLDLKEGICVPHEFSCYNRFQHAPAPHL